MCFSYAYVAVLYRGDVVVISIVINVSKGLSTHVIVVVCGRLIFGSANLIRLILFLLKSGIPTMSKAAVAGLQKENESLKEQIAALKQNFVVLQKSFQRNELPTASNGAHSTPSSLDPETSTSLQFYSQSYDDLNQFRLNANKENKSFSPDLICCQAR